MTTPDQTGVLTKRNQVLPELTDTDTGVKWYQVTCAATNPQYTITLTCATASFTYSLSADGPALTVAVGEAVELSMTDNPFDFYIEINGTLTVLTG